MSGGCGTLCDPNKDPTSCIAGNSYISKVYLSLLTTYVAAIIIAGGAGAAAAAALLDPVPVPGDVSNFFLFLIFAKPKL